jgi:NAD(P)-dependent dehydrogenase (short-subunit alcohol dehydrogenase family)
MTAGRTVLITGAGKGLGLEWARQDLAAGATVLATARDPESSPGLRELEATAGAADHLTTMKMDVTDDASVERAAREVAERASAIDDLIHIAGVFGPKDPVPLEGSPAEVRRVLEVNAVGPYRVTRSFLPLLRKGATPRLLFVTSRMGSIGDGPSGGCSAYRMSKSALNMLGANLAESLRKDGILCLLLHPGWVRTRMGGEGAPVLPPDSVAGMRRVVAAAQPGQSGSFIDFRGEAVPW